jgi:hypothetical protein
VPREDERWGEGWERWMRRSGKGRGRVVLEEVMVGIMERVAKERWMEREVSGEDGPETETEKKSTVTANVDSDEVMLSLTEATEDDGMGEEAPARVRETKLRPVVLADDEMAEELLKPAVRHMLSRLDELLMGLHRARQAYMDSTAESATTDSQAETDTWSVAVSRAQSRTRGNQGKGSVGSRKEPSQAPGSLADEQPSQHPGVPTLPKIPANEDDDELSDATPAAQGKKRRVGRPSKYGKPLPGESYYDLLKRHGAHLSKRQRERSLKTQEKRMAKEELQQEQARDLAGECGGRRNSASSRRAKVNENDSSAEPRRKSRGRPRTRSTVVSPSGSISRDPSRAISEGHLARSRGRQKAALPSKMSTLRASHSRATSRAHSRAGASAMEGGWRDMYRGRFGLRDWSDVLGIASLTDWPPDVIARATQRCATLFGEGMEYRTFEEGTTGSGRVTRYVPEKHLEAGPGGNSEPELVVEERERSHPSKTRSFSRLPTMRQMFFCPHKTCPRNNSGFPRRPNLRLHIKRVHEATSSSTSKELSNIESDEEMQGGVHIDGFLKPIRARKGWRGRDVGQRNNRGQGNRLDEDSKGKDGEVGD